MKRRTRSGERMRNRAMVLMAAAAVVLVAVIAITSPKKNEMPGEVTANSNEKPASRPHESGPATVSASQSESESQSVSQSKSVSQSRSESQSAPESGSKPESASAAASESKPEADPYYEPAMPMMVNPTNKIPEGYKPDVEVIGDGCGYSYDRKAAVAYRAMAAAAKAEGISLIPVSAYRSNERQTNNFNNKIKEFESMGNTAEQAYAATAQLIAVPGTSEHELGLAIDLNSLETSFENTKTFEWLYAHCADYGFILRYPKDKTEITEISYEPWHYRYVGTNHAKIIMEKGICLEEYLSGAH